jgi:2-methylcitrate dehydratase
MTVADQLARFAAAATWDDVPAEARETLELRLLDALGCAIGAQEGLPVRAIRADLAELGGEPRCSFVGGGRGTPPDAALYNSALVRYLDFNDSYLAPGETCHPSDNVGAVLAAAQFVRADGRDLLAALAVAYQVQCRLADEAPVRARYFDHTTQGAYAVAAGVSRALGLDAERTANAVAIAGTALNALRITRTSLSHWKGLAYPFTAFAATRAALLARRGVTGPRAVFEGRKGFMEAIAGPFEIDWEHEPLDAAPKTIVKRFNAEIHSQSAVEAALELRAQDGFAPEEVEEVEVDTFDVAFSIIGGGDEGDKTAVTTKEEADHSLPYMVAVALLDGRLVPEQYEPERIARADVQSLLRRVRVRPDESLSARFPAELGSRLRIRLRNGAVLERTKTDYEGFHTRPVGWDAAERKFETLSARFTDPSLRARIVECIRTLEERNADDLCSLLELVRAPPIGNPDRR